MTAPGPLPTSPSPSAGTSPRALSAAGLSRHARIVVSGLLLAASLWIFALDGSRPEPSAPPEWHTNPVGAFRIRPPPGWDRRSDDRDGSQIAPMRQPAAGFAMLIVSARFAIDPDGLRHIADAVARPPAGPVRALRWEEPRRVTMEDGEAGAVVEFQQTYRGAAVRGVMLVTVRNARLLQGVATVPSAEFAALAEDLERSLLSLRPL